MKVVFMGTPDFSVPALEAIASCHQVCSVYTQPPRPAGRGQKLRPSPVHMHADALGLEVRHPEHLKDTVSQAEFSALEADVAVVVAYGLILPAAVLQAPRYGCLNIHASLLPRWRGAAPIHRAIMAGDTESGICIMQMEAGLDTGPVLLRRAIGIGAEETTGALHERLSELGSTLILEALAALPDLVAEPQPVTGVTYAHKIDKAEAQIDWNRPAAELECHIRGLSPFPGAWTSMNGMRIKILGARRSPAKGVPGTLLSPTVVACGAGSIEITALQPAGGKQQPAMPYAKARGWCAGLQLGA